ncbi:MAG: dehalogenase [Eubacteriales bacterium]
MKLFYILVGILIALSCMYFWKCSREKPLSKIAWSFAVFFVIIGAFTLGWVFESLLERETQAAGMGALIFGGITVLLFLGFKRASKKLPVIKSGGPNIKG